MRVEKGGLWDKALFWRWLSYCHRLLVFLNLNYDKSIMEIYSTTFDIFKSREAAKGISNCRMILEADVVQDVRLIQNEQF